MLDFKFYSPTKFVFGKDSEYKVGTLMNEYNIHRVLIIYGGGSVIRSGLLDRVKTALSEKNIFFIELGGVQPNPRDTLVYKGIDLCLKHDIDCVFGVGAGSVLDTAKAIAMGACSPFTPLFDFFNYSVPLKKALKIASVMTFPATGSEGSSSTVINFEEKKLKRGFNSDLIRPIFAILNPELTYTLSAYQTACGVVDMFCHIMERYFTNTTDVELTDRMCEAVMKTILDTAPKCISNPHDYQTRATIMWASTLAHNNLLGVGRIQDWACHSIEHELSYAYDVDHGAGLAVVTLGWLKYVLPLNPKRVIQFAIQVMGVDPTNKDDMTIATEGIERLKNFYENLGLKTTFEEIGCKKEDIPALVKTVKRNNKEFVGYYVPLNDKAIETIYYLCCKDENNH